MPCDGAITFSDLVGRLEMLRVTCGKCGRAGRYRLERLTAQHGPDAKIPDWIAETPTRGGWSNVIQASNFRLHWAPYS